MTQTKKRKFLPRPDFWAHVFDWDGTGRHHVARLVGGFTLYSLAVYLLNYLTPEEIDFGIPETPYEVAGGALSALLVLRTNAGHDRWWEARKLWGGITNQCRNLAITALANGPADPKWRQEVVAWTVAFAHASRRSLRGQKVMPEVAVLVGTEAAEELSEADHMPGAVASTLASLLRSARDGGTMDPFAYRLAEEQRAMLIDHLGGCERILKTPLAAAYVVLVRRFILLFFLTLPFALIERVGALTPLFVLLIAYPIFALDQIADDLQRPFSTQSINHLPLDDITSTIERNLLALLGEEPVVPVEDEPTEAPADEPA
jgi:putative membrane protein